MIKNLGPFAHPKKKASGMVKRPVSFKPQLGNQAALPTPPQSKPDPVNMNVMDASRTGSTPGKIIQPPVTSANAGMTTAKVPANKKMKTGTVNNRAKKATVPFFGGY